MGIFFKGVPNYLLDFARSELHLGLGIESGTYKGDSAIQMANKLGRVVTVEKSSSLAQAAATRFGNDSRIEVVAGSSRDCFDSVLKESNEPAFFWLDGHWSGGVTAGEDDPCPTEFELGAIAKWTFASKSLVVVDDLRLFGFACTEDPKKVYYPSVDRVLGLLKSMDLNAFLLDDVIVGVPGDVTEQFLKLRGRGQVYQEQLSPAALKIAFGISRVLNRLAR